MNVTYTTKCGDKLHLFIWTMFLKTTKTLLNMTVNVRYKNKDFRLNVRSDDDGNYFIWKKEKIYFKNFDHLTPEQLFNKIVNTDEHIFEEDVFGCLYNYSNELQFKLPCPVIDMKIPNLGIYCTNNTYHYQICHAIETNIFTKNDWSYKITFAPIYEEDKIKYAPRTLYLSDFVHEINNGNIEIFFVSLK